MVDRVAFDKILRKEISLKALCPGNFFYGEQALVVRKFVREIQEQTKNAGQAVQLKTYFLFDTDWPEILDEALNLDIFSFSEKKIFLVYFPEDDGDDQQAPDKAFRQYVSRHQQEIERYFSSPAPNIFIVIIYSGKLKKGQKLLEFFSGLKAVNSGNFDLQEIKTAKEAEIISWLADELAKLGKKITQPAAKKVLEATGSDLVLLAGELEKLSLYASERPEITEEDVSAVCTFQKTFDRFAIEEALESGNLEEALTITGSFFADQPEPSEVINYFASISRYIISLNQAKVQVEGLKVPVREVFKKLRPQILEGWSLFDRKLSAFTSCLNAFSQKDLDNLVHGLAKIDLKLKSSELAAAILLETFLVEFFQLKERKRKG
jgi:DNA polymerase-3 subunit delta